MSYLAAFFALVGLMVTACAQPLAVDEFHVQMMHATVFIKDSASDACGTGFVIWKNQTNGAASALVTADHVLKEIGGEYALITLHAEVGSNRWAPVVVTNRIRNGTNVLYQRHPRFDVAAFYIGLPTNCQKFRVGEGVIFNDPTLEKIHFGPGFELFATGFPLGAHSGPEGFAFLRTGRIASYPILPSNDHPVFYFDMNVFPGNSGGPVYLANFEITDLSAFSPNRTFYRGICGLLTTSHNVTQTRRMLGESITRETPLGIAGVIHGRYIKETLDLLPQLW